jgi:hypothetical protein
MMRSSAVREQEIVAVTGAGPGGGGFVAPARVRMQRYGVGRWVQVDRIDDGLSLAGRGPSRGPVAHEEGLVLIGGDESGGAVAPAVWVSADGYTWIRVSGEAVPGGSDDLVVSSVAAWKAGLVTAGGDQSDGDWDGAVWVSPPPEG